MPAFLRTKRSLALLPLALLAACGTRGTLYTERLTPLAPIATSRSLVSVVPQTQQAVVLGPTRNAPMGLQISEGARAAARVPEQDVVAVLAGSLRAPKLDLIDLVNLEVRTLDLPGAFDRLSLSPDGRVAVLTYAAEHALLGLVARNLNELAVVRLSEGTVTRLQLDTESLAPRSVVFGPAEADRQLVAVALDRGVAIFDALRPEVPARRVSIRPQGSTAESSVLEALFAPSGRFLYLRASRLDDVIAIELSEASGGGVTASINFLAGGQGLTALATPSAATQDSVLALYAASREVLLLDARGITDENLRLPLPEPLTRMHVLPGGRVLIYDGGYRSVVAWDLTSGQSGTAALDSPFDAVFFADALGKAVFRHAAALSIVTVEDATNRLRARIQSIQLSRQAGGMALDAAAERLFFAPVNDSTLVRLDLRNLELFQVTLDAPISSLAHLPEADWVAAMHSGNDFGDLTFLPAGTLARPDAVRVSDYVLTGDLDRAEGL